MTGLTSIAPRRLERAMHACYDADQPAMLWGPPGVAKSKMVEALAQAYGVNLIDIRLSQYDPAELGGIPVPQDGKTVWFPDAIMPDLKRDGENGILFLDELTSCLPPMMAAAYQIVLNRCYRGRALPKGWRVFAAGQRTGDRGVAYAMPSPLANRFTHFQTDPADEGIAQEWLNDWAAWASEVGLNPFVSAFVQFRPQSLYQGPGAKQYQPGSVAFPTPRAHEAIAKHLDAAELAGKSPDPDYIKGTIGTAEGLALLAFLQHRDDVPTIEEIIADPTGARCPANNMGATFFVCGMIAAHTSGKNFAQLSKYLNRLPAELDASIVGLFSAKQRQEVLMTRSGQDWVVRCQHLMR